MAPKPVLHKLSGPEIVLLRGALLSALKTPGDWYDAVASGLDEDFNIITATTASLVDRARDLLTRTEARQRTDELVAAALDIAPKNDDLRSIVDKLRMDTGQRFESIVRERLGFSDVAAWRTTMMQCEFAVCRVEQNLTGADEPLGTGFLVGSDLLITNYHVLAPYIEGALDASRVVFHFDYKLDDGGLQAGTKHVLDAPTWRVHDSHSDLLDFAVVRLAKAAGSDPVPGAPARGYLTPARKSLEDRDPLMIIQHPKAVPLKFALGAVTGFAPAENRKYVSYDVNTQDGSSGSPCFFSDWTLVALHQKGGRTYVKGEREDNRGVLFTAILDDLAANHVAL